jgi:hypothetical protein
MYYARNVFMNTVFCFCILVPKYLKFAAFLKDLLASVCYDSVLHSVDETLAYV